MALADMIVYPLMPLFNIPKYPSSALVMMQKAALMPSVLLGNAVDLISTARLLNS